MTKKLQALFAVALMACAQNVRGISVIAGAVWCYCGVAALSRPVANIAAGLTLMVAGLYPYMRGRA